MLQHHRTQMMPDKVSLRLRLWSVLVAPMSTDNTLQKKISVPSSASTAPKSRLHTYESFQPLASSLASLHCDLITQCQIPTSHLLSRTLNYSTPISRSKRGWVKKYLNV